MIYLVKTGLFLFILGRSGFGIWMVARYAVLFGSHRDDPAESPGARSYGVTNVFLVWLGGFLLATYFLFY